MAKLKLETEDMQELALMIAAILQPALQPKLELDPNEPVSFQEISEVYELHLKTIGRKVKERHIETMPYPSNGHMKAIRRKDIPELFKRAS